MPIDPDTLVANIWPQLHAVSEADVVFTTRDELVRLMGDALKSLAQRFGVFVVRHTTRVLVQGTLMYDAPPRHVSTLHIALLESGKPLTASSTKEMETQNTAYRTFQATAAKPIRWFFEDKSGINQIGIVRVPAALDAGSHLEIIFHQYPCSLDEGIEVIQTFGDYLEACAMASAYEPESDFQIVESAQSYKALAGLYEQAAAQYWGKAQ